MQHRNALVLLLVSSLGALACGGEPSAGEGENDESKLLGAKFKVKRMDFEATDQDGAPVEGVQFRYRAFKVTANLAAAVLTESGGDSALIDSKTGTTDGSGRATFDAQTYTKIGVGVKSDSGGLRVDPQGLLVPGYESCKVPQRDYLHVAQSREHIYELHTANVEDRMAWECGVYVVEESGGFQRKLDEEPGKHACSVIGLNVFDANGQPRPLGSGRDPYHSKYVSNVVPVKKALASWKAACDRAPR